MLHSQAEFTLVAADCTAEEESDKGDTLQAF